jgi:hypothetical protein
VGSEIPVPVSSGRAANYAAAYNTVLALSLSRHAIKSIFFCVLINVDQENQIITVDQI